jgi:uncharacterized protein DUF1707
MERDIRKRSSRSIAGVTGREGWRASDADREQIAERLRVAATEGRLHDDELEERLAATFSARTYGELDRVVADLPAPPAPRRRDPAFGLRPGVTVAIALVLAFVLLSTVSFGLGHGHGEHHGGSGIGPAVWLIWLAIGWRYLVIRRRRGVR